MILERGDMWSIAGITDWFLITTNPIVNKQGLAVMGRGMAKEAADRFPTLRKDFAGKLTNKNYLDHPVFTIGVYQQRIPSMGLLDLRIGCFMVKHHWQSPASLSLIHNSCESLCSILQSVISEDPFRVDLNFPGIGNGGLPREDVLPIIEQLPNSVHIWEKE